jgi:hypothetical protein
MWFWPVNETTELVSGMPAPQFGDESSRVRGSGMVQGSRGSVRSFGVPQAEGHSSIRSGSVETALRSELLKRSRSHDRWVSR